MKNIFLVFISISILGLVSCASGPKRMDMTSETAKTYRHIGIIEMDNMEHYHALSLSATPALFGLIGGLVSGSNQEARREKLSAAINNKGIDLGLSFTETLKSNLEEKGYEVTVIKGVREKYGFIVEDTSKIDSDVDAYLDVIINIAGFVDRGVGKPYRPIINTRAQLTRNDTDEVVFLNVFNYGYKLVNDQWTHIPQVGDKSYPDFKAIMEDIDGAIVELEKSIVPIVNGITGHF
jgi:hypothetical protein